MSEAIQAALISVVGMVAVAGITGWIQFLVTRVVIRSEQAKLSRQLQAERVSLIEQLRNESLVRRWETKYNRLADLLGEYHHSP